MTIITKTAPLFLFLLGFCLIGCADSGSAKVIVEELSVKTGHSNEPLELTVHFNRIYLDGEVSTETKEVTIWSMEDFWNQYSSWQLVDMNTERLIFQQEINDISPLLKMNGYVGITKDGMLSTFNGEPGQAEVIQSFFQIDVKKLESNKQLKLQEGIPVKTKEDFSQIMKTMKEYAIEETKSKQ